MRWNSSLGISSRHIARQGPQCVADAQQDLRLRIGGHVAQQRFAVVEVEAARAAVRDEPVGHVDERRTLASQVVGQQRIEAPAGRVAVEGAERAAEGRFVERQRLHRVARGGHARRGARREDRLGFPVAAIDLVALEKLDGQVGNLPGMPHLLRFDADQGEVLAVGCAGDGLASENLQRQPLERLAAIDSEYRFGTCHHGQRYDNRRAETTFPAAFSPAWRCGPFRRLLHRLVAAVPRPLPPATDRKRRLLRVSPCNRRFGRTASGGRRMRCMCTLYFLPLGASIMFIFLPSSLGIISTLATSSRSVAKRSSRISPCSLKTIERPRKKT